MDVAIREAVENNGSFTVSGRGCMVAVDRQPWLSK